MANQYRSLFFCLSFFPAFSLCVEPAEKNAEIVLEEIEVRESSPGAHSADNFSAIKATLTAKELPFSIEKLSPTILQNLRAHSLESLLDKYTTGVVSPAEGGLTSAIVLRGFTDASFYRNGLNDSLGTVPLRDVANIESVEILKGANSALYGSGEPGGTINIITRQPKLESSNSVQLNIGNYQSYRTELDSTGSLPFADKLAYRLIAAYENAGSFRDTVESSKVFAAPSVSWSPDEYWKVLGEVEFIQHKTPYDTGLILFDDRQSSSRSRFVGEPGLGKTRLQAVTSSLSVEYKEAESWNLSAKLLWKNTNIDGFNAEPDELVEVDVSGALLLSRQVQRRLDDAQGFSAQLELGRQFINRSVQQQILAGYEYISADNHNELDGSDVDVDPFEIDIFNVRYNQPVPALSAIRRSDETLTQHSFYIQDFVRFGDKLKVLLGTRLDKLDIDSKDVIFATDILQSDTELSSRAGLVFDLTKGLSLFASYGESIEPNEGLTPSGDPLKPSLGESVETGLKFRHRFMDLSVDASVFSIEQTNVAVDAPGEPGFELQTARQKSEGLDMGISLRPVEWMHAKINYAYTDAQIFDDPEIPDGTQPINAPLHKLVLSGLFALSVKNENDLQAGVNISYRSAQKASQDADELEFKLPGYWLADLFFRYVYSPQLSLGLNITNLLGENYLAASQADINHIQVGIPFTITGSVKYSF